MSKSRRDQRGKRTNNEILGRSCFSLAGDRLIARCGGDAVGSPSGKRDAKREAGRMRRRANAKIAAAERPKA